jgi:2'-5' RNA ligase
VASNRRSERPGSPRARLFVALDLPAGALEPIARWRDAAIAARDDLRPVQAVALHVTLVFLGWRYEREIGRVTEVVAAAADGAAPPRLSPIGLVPVPPRRPRLFALDLADDDGRATALQERLAGALEDARLHRREQRPFWPHVTLARVKRGHRAEPLEADPPAVEPFTATTVTLYRSTLLPQGARYDSLACVELA